MNKPGKSFFTANSKNGRKIASAQAPLRIFHPQDQSPEVREWNARVEAKKREKMERKNANA